MNKRISAKHSIRRFNKFANRTKRKNKVGHYSRGGIRL